MQSNGWADPGAFSAKEDMKYIHKKLSEEKVKWALHMQREGSSQDGVITEFRASKGVLLSTGVFWGRREY